MKPRRKTRKRTPKRLPKKTRFFLVEGATEETYVRYLQQIYKKSNRLMIYQKSKLGKNIKEDIELIAERMGVKTEDIILLYDLENDVIEYKKFIDDHTLIHPNTYLVQPCIEYHFLMHHKNFKVDPNKLRRQKETENELKTYLPRYKKGGKFSWVKNGIDRNEVELAKSRSLSSFKDYDQKSFSTIGRMINDLFV